MCFTPHWWGPRCLCTLFLSQREQTFIREHSLWGPIHWRFIPVTDTSGSSTSSHARFHLSCEHKWCTCVSISLLCHSLYPRGSLLVAWMDNRGVVCKEEERSSSSLALSGACLDVKVIAHLGRFGVKSWLDVSQGGHKPDIDLFATQASGNLKLWVDG